MFQIQFGYPHVLWRSTMNGAHYGTLTSFKNSLMKLGSFYLVLS